MFNWLLEPIPAWVGIVQLIVGFGLGYVRGRI